MWTRHARKPDSAIYIKTRGQEGVLSKVDIYDHWICFDGRLRPICRVEIDLDLSDEKPIRPSPYHLSPAETLIAKELTGGFIEDGILNAATSDWAFPIAIDPKPGTGKPGEKKDWRLCIDLRKLN